MRRLEYHPWKEPPIFNQSLHTVLAHCIHTSVIKNSKSLNQTFHTDVAPPNNTSHSTQVPFIAKQIIIQNKKQEHNNKKKLKLKTAHQFEIREEFKNSLMK
jgi:hypothetical protein